MRSAYLSPDQIKNIEKSNRQVQVPCDLSVFKSHYGFRPGEVHVLIGKKGEGKSTWIKTILAQLSAQSIPTLVYLSEETPQAYFRALNSVMAKLSPHDQAKDALEDILVVSEVQQEIDTVAAFEKSLGIGAEYNFLDMVKMLIIDNFTTSFMGDTSVSEQSKVYRKLVRIAVNYNIPVLILAHVQKNAKFSIFDSDMVRGSGTGVNTAAYTYVIDQVMYGEKKRNFIYTEKSRHHPEASKKLYEVFYEPKLEIFTRCEKTDVNEYIKIKNKKINPVSF